MSTGISGARVFIDGNELDELGQVVEVRVEDNLMLPDAFTLRVADPGLGLLDQSLFEVGNEIRIDLSGLESKFFTPVIAGQITRLEPRFEKERAEIVVRGLDHSHALHRTRKTKTFQNMTSSDIARKVAGDAGLQIGTVEASGPNPPHKFVQQNNETDWELLWRLARLHDFEVLVADETFHFRPAGKSVAKVKMTWGAELLAFYPRVTGVQQVDDVVVRVWDPDQKDVIEVRERVGEPGASIGIKRADVSSALGGGTFTVAGQVGMSRGEAEARAKSVAAQLAHVFLEADGVCLGNETIRAGTELELEGLGKRFSGTYTCSSTTHVYRGGKGYETRFTVSGRNPRTLLDLMTQPRRKSFGNSVVVGKVTQNQDPDKLGRVRVTYPELGPDNEGWWARVASPSAGKDRGLLMMPVVDEEVLIAFEHDDVRRPYVLGSLWNGKDTPGDLVQTDGSLALKSDKAVDVAAKEVIQLKGEKDYTLEAKGKVTQKADGDLVVESGANVTVKSGGSLTIEGGSEITIKVGAAKISLSAAGVVQLSGTQVTLG